MEQAVVEVLLGGETHTLHCGEHGDAARRSLKAGLNAPYSCQAGMCASCMCQVVEGSVHLRRNDVLDKRPGQSLDAGLPGRAHQRAAAHPISGVNLMSLISDAPTSAVPPVFCLVAGARLAETLPALLRQAAARTRSALPSSMARWRSGYADLLARSQAVARALMALNVQAGDRVAVWAPNLRVDLAACGSHAAGAVVVPLNTRMKGAEAADILERSSAEGAV